MKAFKHVYKIYAPIANVWRAITDAGEIQKWGGGPNVIMNDSINFRFRLWNGNIIGQNLEVIKEKHLKQTWWKGEWVEPSHVTFTLSEYQGITTIELIHENLPDDEAESFEEGLEIYYMGPMKEMVEEEFKIQNNLEHRSNQHLELLTSQE